MVVALVDPGAAADVRRGEQLGQSGRRFGRGGKGGARPRLDAIPGRLVGQQVGRDLSERLAGVEGAQLAGIRDLADRRAVELPARADLLDRLQEPRPDDRHHPLLRLRDHDLPRFELLPERHPVEVDVHSRAVARHLGERGRETGRAAVLERLDEPALDQLHRDLDQLLARERVADLDGRPLLRGALAELLAREHARAADPVAAGGRAVEDELVPGRARARAGDPVGGEQPDAHGVDEAVVRVGRIEDGLAADRRDADRVAVGADPGDRAVEVMVGGAEPQAVQQGDRPRAHRDDVPQDPADAGRGALKRLDRARMVVRLDLERDRLAPAEVDHARVLAGPLEDALAAAREPLEQQRRVLVAAVLRPEQREDGELEVVRLPLEQLADTVELPVREAERAVELLFRDLRQRPQDSREG